MSSLADLGRAEKKTGPTPRQIIDGAPKHRHGADTTSRGILARLAADAGPGRRHGIGTRPAEG